MKDRETENQRLRKAIADLTLDKLILQEASRGPEGQRQQSLRALRADAPVSSTSSTSCTSPSAAPVARLVSIARHSARSRGAVMTKRR